MSTLRRFVTTASGVERCDICGAPVVAEHQHLLELTSRRLFCACESCVRSLGDSEPFRLVVPKTAALDDFQLTDTQWEALQLPIDLAFLFVSTRDGRPVVIYPGAAGGMESSLSGEAWSNLAATNPALSDISPDVEALLINRTKGSRDYYRVSIDRCYALTGLIRQQWAGLSGGADLWNSIDNFFSSLRSDGASQRNARSRFHG
ncbi:DUF5947 family protein [Methylosinus sporium]|uniref:DUF5947 family protein n=1 Tax=Methylosinus sporium TaxID=428 RepID=UPI001FCF075C|nr:DUF5947 family protein [Methylosinus sporium]